MMQKRRETPFAKTIGNKEQRRLKARADKDRTFWIGFSMFGLVGWSVAVPTLICTAIGVWIDERAQSGYSWTLMLLLAGLVIGCFNAWYWVEKTRKE